MSKLLRYIPLGVIALALSLGAFAVTPSFAQSDQFQGEKIVRMVGDQLHVTTAVTTDSFDFGFTSDFVRTCVEADTGAEGVLMRFGHTVDDSAPAFGPQMSMTILATSEAIFYQGASNVLEGRAIRLLPGGDGTDTVCRTEPWRTNGVTAGFARLLQGTIAASVDVTAYQTVKDRERR
tara:strand:- start:521 stop:1054 length:534 start_codon:yes stop_codon:yes gene_type:complete